MDDCNLHYRDIEIYDRLGSLKYNFYFEIILDLQEFGKDNPESHHILVTQCPLMLTPCIVVIQVSQMRNPHRPPLATQVHTVGTFQPRPH